MTVSRSRRLELKASKPFNFIHLVAMAEREIRVILLQVPPPGSEEEYELLGDTSLSFSVPPQPSDLREVIIDEVHGTMPGFETSGIKATIYLVRLTLLHMDYLLPPAFPTAERRSTDSVGEHQSGLPPKQNAVPERKVEGGGDIGHCNCCTP